MAWSGSEAWITIERIPDGMVGEAWVQPAAARCLRLDPLLLQDQLGGRASVIRLPTPDGTFARFRVR
ncbi:MAG: hypothetical protein AAF492_11405, partial [Verrucomicrobiota bacterium]